MELKLRTKIDKKEILKQASEVEGFTNLNLTTNYLFFGDNFEIMSKMLPLFKGKIDLSKFERPRKELVANKKNYYIIDTNVFVDCPDVINKIDKKYPIILWRIIFKIY